MLLPLLYSNVIQDLLCSYLCFTHALRTIYYAITFALPCRYPLFYPRFAMQLPLLYPRFAMQLPLLYHAATLVLPPIYYLRNYLCFTMQLPSLYPRGLHRPAIAMDGYSPRLTGWTGKKNLQNPATAMATEI